MFLGGLEFRAPEGVNLQGTARNFRSGGSGVKILHHARSTCSSCSDDKPHEPPKKMNIAVSGMCRSENVMCCSDEDVFACPLF